MARSRWLVAGLVLAATAGALPATADVADPVHSKVNRILMVCPEGDAVFRVEARTFSDTPKPGVDIVIAFGPCPVFPVCPELSGDPETYTIDVPNRTITKNADGQGVAEFPIRMGGTCPDSLVRIYADGVPLAQRSVVSPDQNGDLVVDAADLALLEAKLGQADPTGDFDGDGAVTAADVAVLQAHMGHICPVATRVAPATWGRLKLLYR